MSDLASSLLPPVFEDFRKIARLNRTCVITEKIDGTNAQIFIGHRMALQPTIPPCLAMNDEYFLYAGSRTRWIHPQQDNHGFAKWAQENADELFKLGPGRHFGEWWGSGIQRGYGLVKGDKRFSLFNTAKWSDPATRPACCGVVPVLYEGPFTTGAVNGTLDTLREHGSFAAPFMNPEGIVVYHTHAGQYFKVTLENDELPKSLVK